MLLPLRITVCGVRVGASIVADRDGTRCRSGFAVQMLMAAIAAFNTAVVTIRGAILSGDSATAVALVAAQLALSAQCEMQPQDERDATAVLTAKGHRVPMLGDGLNDGSAPLISVALLRGLGDLAAFFWALRSGRFKDLGDGAGCILIEDDEPEQAVGNRLTLA